MLMLFLVTACERGERSDIAASPPLRALPGVYAGEWPCSNCTAIDVTLWLRPDGRFFLRQIYVGEDRATDERAYALGRWRWDRESGRLALTGRGPERRLAVLDPGRLELDTASPLAHSLVRQVSAAAFTDSLRLEGRTALMPDKMLFAECVSGLTLEVAPKAGHDQLRRQRRSVSRDDSPALAVVEGHLEIVPAPPREALVVERVITIKPGEDC